MDVINYKMSFDFLFAIVENGTETFPKYRRSCAYTSFKNIGCSQQNRYLNGKAMVLDICYCDTDECNRKMGPIEPSTESPETSTKGIERKNKILISMMLYL